MCPRVTLMEGIREPEGYGIHLVLIFSPPVYLFLNKNRCLNHQATALDAVFWSDAPDVGSVGAGLEGR